MTGARSVPNSAIPDEDVERVARALADRELTHGWRGIVHDNTRAAYREEARIAIQAYIGPSNA